MHSLFVQAQRSLPLFDANLLTELYVKGYAPLVAQLLVKLTKSLEKIGRDQVITETHQSNSPDKRSTL